MKKAGRTDLTLKRLYERVSQTRLRLVKAEKNGATAIQFAKILALLERHTVAYQSYKSELTK